MEPGDFLYLGLCGRQAVSC